MITLPFGIRSTIAACGGAACLCACSATPYQPTPFAAAPSDAMRVTTNESASARSATGPSWMASDAKQQNLLYVGGVHVVNVYSYPQGKLEGRLRGFYRTEGECVDKKGDIYITNLGTNEIFEYAHGGTKRLATLKGYGGATGCAIDPTTGNLAVTNIEGYLAVYKGARGKPTVYTDRKFQEFFFCGYDDKGNLFVDGQNRDIQFELAELPKGVATLASVTLDQSIGWPAGVQWDGKYVAVGNAGKTCGSCTGPTIYRFAIQDGRGQLAGSTALGGGAWDVYQFWIDGKTVIVPNEYCHTQCLSDVLFFAFPSGGTATKKILQGRGYPEGVVVSEAAK
jgi:hypothetical protein